MKNTNAARLHLSIKAATVTGENAAVVEEADQSRRRFMHLNLLGLVLAPTVGLLASEKARAGRTGRITDDTPAIVDPADAQAQALSYTAQSSKDGESCSNCQIYSGTEGEKFGPCAIFSYRVAASGKELLVNASGWCRAWAPRQTL
jgi:hypothetical protein